MLGLSPKVKGGKKKERERELETEEGKKEKKEKKEKQENEKTVLPPPTIKTMENPSFVVSPSLPSSSSLASSSSLSSSGKSGLAPPKKIGGLAGLLLFFFFSLF